MSIKVKKKKKKKGRGKGKGSDFERVICKALSKWFTGEERDDVFWRTDGSGGRATVRGRVGKRTFGQYGDIQASDPIGQPLISFCCIELKCGYGDWSFLNLLTKKLKKHPFTEFLSQVKGDQEVAGTRWWILISKKDRCKPTITIPKDLYRDLYSYFGNPDCNMIKFIYNEEETFTFKLENFFVWVDPIFFTEIAK